MIILSNSPASPDCSQLHQVLLFGSGLVGSTILDHLSGMGWKSEQRVAIDWIDQQQRSSQLQKIRELVPHSTDGNSRIDIIWAAGNALFHGEKEIFDVEWEAFSDILTLTRNLAEVNKLCDLSFHLLSSAGGLFDGKTSVQSITTPDPRKPYGMSKLRQEGATLALPKSVRSIIYRPSSIYGFVPNGRSGLISSLVLDALNGKTTNILSHPNTIRDFVFVDDVAQFVSDCVTDFSKPSQTHLLVSGQPTSLSETIALVRAALNVPMNVEFNPKPEEPVNNSYIASSLPAGFCPTPLVEGIQKTVQRMSHAQENGMI